MLGGIELIAVVGSSNVDLVVSVDHFTKPGETQACISFSRHPGGKGANQAVACKKLGADVFFLSVTGSDGNGEFIREELRKHGVHNALQVSDAPNGFALIEVASDGQNRIIIYGGSNSHLTPELIEKLQDDILRSDLLLIQNEIPFSSTVKAAQLFKSKGKLVVFDPAPAQNISSEIFPYVDIITPNESEMRSLLNKNISPEEGIEQLLKLGCENVLLKLGEKGCLFHGKMGQFRVEAFKVNTVDSTAAGDVFNAAFATELERSKNIEKSLIFASAAAAISVTRHGAQPSIPTLAEVNEFLKSKGIKW